MQVVVHYPKSTVDQRILSQKIAEIHTQSVINRIKEMQLSEEDMKKLISMMSEKVNRL
ncbi:MAG: hypothetical protein NC320_05425 [Clostridium sp.]|nr:hypothetical protein [Clostridium sp.]